MLNKSKAYRCIAVCTLVTGPTLVFTQQPPAGGWVIEYKGELDVYVPGYSSLFPRWKKQDYSSFTVGDVYDANSPAPVITPNLTNNAGSQITGSVSVRLRWTGSGAPSSYPNYSISTYTQAISSQFNAFANDGFTTRTGFPVYFGSQKLIQPGKVTTSETTLNISIHGNGPSDAAVLAYALVANIDTRKARVKASSIPEEYYVKGSDFTPPLTYTLTDHLWDGNNVMVQTYSAKQPQVSNPVTSVGASTVETRVVGLPQGLSHSSGPGSAVIVDTSNLLGILFTGDITKTKTGQQWYSFNESMHSTSVSENLPSFGADGPGWDVEPIGPFGLAGPNNDIRSDGSAVRIERTATSDTATLNYRWDDGLEANSQMILTFIDQFTNPQPIMAKVVHEFTPTKYAFPNGGVLGGTKDVETWDNRAAKPVQFSIGGTVYKAGNTAVTVAATAAALMNPEGLIIPATISLMGTAMSFGSLVVDDTHTLTPDDPFTSDTPEVKHVLIFDSNVQQLLAGMTSSSQKLTYLNYVMKWKAEYLPEEEISVFSWETYGPAGYLGPTTQQIVRPLSNQCNSLAKRFTYIANDGPITPGS